MTRFIILMLVLLAGCTPPHRVEIVETQWGLKTTINIPKNQIISVDTVCLDGNPYDGNEYRGCVILVRSYKK